MMEKTININIAGVLFRIDEEAYKILRDYLHAIDMRFRNMKGGTETIEDIESRIAEIFQSQKGVTGEITRENVDSMISIIGKPEDFDITETEKEPIYNSPLPKRMYRNPDDTIISGVCGGIGAYLNTDPVLLRILFVLFTVFFGFGLIAYIILWIALPPANTETRKREMYGDAYNTVMSQNRKADGSFPKNGISYNKGYYNNSRIGNAFDEIFRATGRVFYIIMRIFLVIIGAILMVTGFLFLLSFVLIFVFKFPGVFSAEEFDIKLFYLPDFLNYIVNPVFVPWILVLSAIAYFLPVIAMIYWGVKMIFWFKVKDGLISIILLIVWVLSLTSLVMILFSEGISFAETTRSSVKIPYDNPRDTVCLTTANRLSDLRTGKGISFNADNYSVMINEEKQELYISPEIEFIVSGEEPSGIAVKKESSGKSEADALNKTKELVYNYSLNGDTLFLDDYFTVPQGRRWSADFIEVDISLPVGTTLKIDSCLEKILKLHNNYDGDNNDYPLIRESGYSYWKLTSEGLRPADPDPSDRK